MWKSAKLGDVCNIINGSTPSRKELSYWENGNILWFTIDDLRTQGREITTTAQKITAAAVNKTSVKLIPANSVLLCCTASIGEVAIARSEMATNQQFNALVPKTDNLLPEYLYYFASTLKEKLLAVSGSATINFVAISKLKNISILIPPLAEQQSIVAKLDAAFAEIDEAILKIEAKSINAEKIFLNGVDAHFTETSVASKTSKLFEITSKIGSGATPKGGKAAYKTEGISLIRSMNVHDINFKWKDLAKIDDAQADKLSNVEVFKNDVLLNITGASVARCCVVDEAALPARVNQHVAIIRPLEDTVLTDYLAYLLVSKTYKDLLLTVGEGGGATRQAITKAEIEQFTISYPSSIDEQVSLVEKFDKLRKQVLNLKANYEKQVNEFQSLKSAILAQELRSEAA